MRINNGVVLTRQVTGPTKEELRFVSYEAKCPCGWRFTTEDDTQTLAVRDLAEQHSDVCRGC